MKILFPIQYYYPSQIGGPANTLHWHVEYLQKYSVETTVISSSSGIETKTGIKLDKWIQTKCGKVKYCRGGRLNIKLFINTLQEIIHTDIVHFSSICYPYTYPWCILAIVLGKNIILSPRGELFSSAIKYKKFIKLLVISFYKLIQKRIIFHATSDKEKKTIRFYFSKAKILVRPNFVDIQYVSVPQERMSDLIFLGRINPIKGLENLIEAISKSKIFLESSAKLLIVGKARQDVEQKYELRLKKQIETLSLCDRVIFLGHIEGDAKFKLLNMCKALVLPSYSENFGNVVVEALSMSVPVIASYGTPWEILNSNKMGWWTNNSPEGLRESIDSLYNLDDESYKQYCNNAVEYIKSSLDINISPHNDWLKIYNNLNNE